MILKYEYNISWKIRPVGADLFHADVRADMTKLIVVFRNVANAPKTSLYMGCLVRLVIPKQVRVLLLGLMTNFGSES